MAQCPSCQQQIEIGDQHFGTLFTCPLCQAVFFVGWDGQPERSTEPTDVTSEPSSEPIESVNYSVEPVDHFGEPQHQDPNFEPLIEEQAQFSSENFEVSVPSTDFQDVTQFANSDLSVGPLSYTVQIKGIELAHIHEAVKDAITDSRFGWDSTAILAQIRNGELELSNLSPAKAAILVHRIKSLPVEVSWRQDVLATL